jgi:hypothetical protein
MERCGVCEYSEPQNSWRVLPRYDYLSTVVLEALDECNRDGLGARDNLKLK